MRAALGLLITLGCGGPTVEPSVEEAVASPMPLVEIFPDGARFQEPLQVRLLAQEDVAIWFSLDGTDPLPGEGLPYAGPFEVDDTVLVRALGVGPDGRWTGLSSALFERAEARVEVDDVPRALTVDRAQLVFAVGPETQESVKTLVLSSRGTEAVTILSFELVSSGSGSFETGVFELVDPPRSQRLEPGQRALLDVRYRSTRTMRNAELGIFTDGSSPPSGRVSVQLAGRMFP
ncbi:MAG: chitobiase/beta-hexosaminidase C-terminal domain-containing protein [Myxococcota bacterium]